MNYYNEYVKAKKSLAVMILQFGDFILKHEDKDEMLPDVEGYYSWVVLQNDDINITGEDVYNLGFSRIDDEYVFDYYEEIIEEDDPNLNYYKEYLRVSLIVAYMVEKNCKDIYTNYSDQGDYYHHLHESAGEKAWKLLGFDDDVIPKEMLDNKINELKKELLKLKSSKKKIKEIR